MVFNNYFKSMQEQTQTLIADFAMHGRLAYLSHQETLTLFQRALLRTGVPVAFSGGFNPRPRVSLPLPRSVGTQSDAERLCAVLSPDESVRVESVRTNLAAQLPAGCVLTAVRCLAGKHTFHPTGVRYAFLLTEHPGAGLGQHLAACQEALTAEGPLTVRRFRAKRKTYEAFDIRPFVERLTFSANRIEVDCRVSQEGSVRIDELMQWLYLNTEHLVEPVKRTAVQWNEHYQEQH